MESIIKCQYCGTPVLLRSKRHEQFQCGTEIEYTPMGYRWTQTDECKKRVEALRMDAAKRNVGKTVKAVEDSCETVIDMDDLPTATLTKDVFDELVESFKDEDNPVGKIDTRDTADVMSYAFQAVKGSPKPTNFDSHYAEKEVEPIDVIEETEKRLHAAGVDPIKAGNVVRGLKYILRAGLKEGEDANKDIRKAANYLHRAETGRWL